MSVQKALSPKADYCPPQPDGDFYRIADVLDESERAVLKLVRDFMDREVAPIIEDYWVRDQFPFGRRAVVVAGGRRVRGSRCASGRCADAQFNSDSRNHARRGGNRRC